MELLSVAEHRMYNDKLTKNKSVRNSIVTNLENMLLNRCFESEGHPARVRQLADKFVAFLGIDLPAAERKLLNQLAQLHDIGKVAIPAGILGSPRTLTAGEWDIIKSHSEVGYRMAQSIDEPVLADIILALHERWDGLGYPCGLKEDQIPFLARLFAITDTYDTIIHDRPYRPARDKQTALREIEAGRGTQFDPKLAKSFVEFIRQKEAAK